MEYRQNADFLDLFRRLLSKQFVTSSFYCSVRRLHCRCTLEYHTLLTRVCMQPQQQQQQLYYNLHRLPPIVCEDTLECRRLEYACERPHLTSATLRFYSRPVHQLPTRRCQLWFRVGRWQLVTSGSAVSGATQNRVCNL